MVRHGWKIFLELRKEEPQKIEYSNAEVFLLGCSVSYILTYVLTII
jgi:hypothetical protein